HRPPASGSGFHEIMPDKVCASRPLSWAIVAPAYRLGLLLRDGCRSATVEPVIVTASVSGLVYISLDRWSDAGA
ncbi:hypothetical protein PUR56_06200, partial [Streptomyces sp. BE303]|nr:hypothetical protein [Streptomyces sp. BE303]